MNSQSKLGQPQIDIKQTKSVVCEKCGEKLFAEGMMMREVSPLFTGTGQKGIIPVPVFYCVKCGHVNTDFIPVEIRDEV